MKVLSLFDGMACGMIAFKELGIPIERYVAYEIDKFAVKTATHNFPQIQEMGDVFAADFNEYRGFDWLVGGSPCTYWSIAQKNNREIEASGIGWELFSQYVRALHEAQPKYFIYENNKSMSKQIRASIDEAFGFDAVLINSDLVSAQNRQRLYWVGKRNADGTYSKVNVEQPINRGILLKDILENGCDLTSNDKSYCMTASYDGACSWNTIERNQRTMIAEPVATDKDGKAFCLTANYAGAHIPHSLEKSVRGMCAEPVNITAKAISRADGKTYQVYEVENGLITIKNKQYPIKLADGFYIIRKLTVSECKRLQTVPDWYEFPVSKAQAYKMLGNGWTVDVIKHLITSAYNRPVVNWTKQMTFDEFV